MFKRTSTSRRMFLAALLGLCLTCTFAPVVTLRGGTGNAAAPPWPAGSPWLHNHAPSREPDLHLRVLFQGGDVAGNAAKVLLVLHRIAPLKLKTHMVEAGETIPDIYAKHLDLPGTTPYTFELAEALNHKDYRSAPLTAGEQVLYPDADLDAQEVHTSFHSAIKNDRAELEQVKKAWVGYIKKEKVDADQVKLELESFRLEVPRASAEQLNESIDAINKLTDAGIRVESSKVLVEEPDYTFGVRLQGRDVISYAEWLITSLVNMKVLNLVKHTVQAGETVDSIYKQRLDISGSFTKLAESLNKSAKPDFDASKLRVGDEVLVPDIKFQTFRWMKTISLSSKEGQQTLAELQSSAWKHLLPRVLPISADTAKVVLLGYQFNLNAGSRERLQAVYQALSGNKSKDIRLSFPSLLNEKQVLHSAEEPLAGDDFWNRCCAHLPAPPLPRGVQGYIGSYVDIPIRESIEAASRCTGNACPQIVLIDKNIKPHPDIAAALIDEQGRFIRAPALLNETDNTQTITSDSYVEANDHGTHLAGIIASKDNEFGLVGINPYVKILPVELDVVFKNAANKFAFDDLINDGATGPFRIYVFASEWSTADRQGDDRAQVIRSDAKPLFIAAAGQKDGQSRGVSIDKGNTTAPMNLGNEPNVVIVTGCNPCSRKNGQPPRLDAHANYSAGTDKYVHIAAPMQPIPSTLANGAYGTGGGTSQAAALVGGVASLMASGFSYYNNSPLRIKFRLQVTSLPELPLEDARLLATGILDPTKALLDPQRNYLAGNDRVLNEFNPSNWCVSNIDLRSAGSASAETIPVKQIYRIYQTQTGEWVIYYSKAPLSGVVQKAGPGDILSDPDRTLLFKAGGEGIKLNDFTDLLFASDNHLKVGQCNQ
jgi:hypothetical protein